MNITKNLTSSKLTIALEGRLDIMSAPTLDADLKESLEGVKELIFDLEKLDYISSAGLRVLLMAHKTMAAQGKMTIIHVNEMVQEIFEVTGFDALLNIA